MQRLKGKVAIVTGGAGGIGAATAKRFVEEGASVTITDIASDGAARAGEIGCDFIEHDISDEEAWRKVIAAVDAKHGRIDCLVNGAGIEGDVRDQTPAHTELEEWRRIFAVNVEGTFLGCKSVLPVMERQREGVIVNLSSATVYTPSPTSCAYGASKAAIQHFTKSVAAYGARDGMRIRCNSVHPGIIRTRMLLNIARAAKGVGAEEANEAAEAMARGKVAFGVLGEPEEVAAMILYLASDEASYVTGSEFRIDGGRSLTM